MRKTSKAVVCLLLALALLLPSFSMAAGRLYITTQPKDCHVKPGGTASFTAKAENDTGVTWRLVSPDGTEEFLVRDVGEHFRGVTVSGRNRDTVKLLKVTKDMHGWQVYCTFGNADGRVATEMATIYIIGVETTDDNDEDDFDENPHVYEGDDALAVTVVGATLEIDGADMRGEYDFTNEGTIDFKVSASYTPAYWVINGARYDFDRIPSSFTVRKLTYPMVIEAVRKSGKAQTLLSNDELQAKRTGETLLATAKSSNLCHVRASGNGAGGWFNEFDFTDDFKNKATSKMEKGGRVTLRVRASIPEGKRISYWEFNDARLDFSRDVTEFLVTNLNETMEYQPIFGGSATDSPNPTSRPTDSVIIIPVPGNDWNIPYQELNPTATVAPTATPAPTRRPTTRPDRPTPRPTTTPAPTTPPVVRPGRLTPTPPIRQLVTPTPTPKVVRPGVRLPR